MDDHERLRRAQRREFVRRQHPDRGGDAATFTAGLAQFDRYPVGERSADRARVVVVTRRPLAARVVQLLLHGRRPRPRRVR